MKPFHVDFTGDIILRPDLHYLYNAAGLTVGILHPLPEGNIALWQTQRLRPAAGPIPASVLGLADGKQRILLMTACAGCLNRAMSLSSLLEPAGNYLRVIQQNLLHTKIDPRLRQLAEAAITKFNEVLSSRGDLVNSIADAAIKAIGMPATNEAINNIRSLIYEARAGSQTWTLSDNQKVAALGMAITLPVAHAAALLLDLQTHERWILELGPDNSITPAKRRPTVAILAGASRSAPNSEGKVSFLAASEGRHDLEKVLPFTAIMVVQCAARAQDAAGDPNKVVAHMAYEAMDKICAEAMTAKDPGETATANIRDWWGSPLGACVDVRFVKLHDADLLASLGANRNQLYGDVFYAHFSSADVCEAIQRTGGLYLFSDTAYLRAVCLQSRPDGGAATPEMMDLLEEIGIQIELLDPLLSDTGVNELGARVAQQLEQGMKALFPDIAQHDHLTNRIGLYTTFGTVQSLTTLDRDNPVEFLFARKGGKLAPIIDLQPAAWQANDRQLFHLSDSRLYLLPCNALSAAAILICINGGRNLASTMLWPELNRGRVYLTDAALDYQYKLNTGSADELWEHPCAHLGLAAGLALTGQAGAGMVPDFVGAKPIHAARAKTAVRHQLQAADAPEPLPMPGLQLNLGESGPVLDAKTVEAAAEDEMEEMDLASLLFTMPSPKRQRGADAAA